MARRRGFLAEMQHQSKVAARHREQAFRAAAREHAAAIRRAEQAHREAERARAQAARAAAADLKRAEQEARRLHLEAMEAEVASLNAQLASDYDEIATMLSATLEVDDFVDLELLRAVPEHPPFDQEDLEAPHPPPPPVVAPPEPRFVEPEAPTGLGGMFGGKKRHAERVAQAHAAFVQEHQTWQTEVSQIPTLQLKQLQAHEQAEQHRQAALAEARRVFQAECDERQRVADESNGRLDKVILGLERNVEEAVQEYVSIVLGNSVYPECFPVDHDFVFDSGLRELALKVLVPGPEELLATKAYKYAKGSDEITSTALSQKQLKDRYAAAVHQVALRSVHEVFEADRRGCVQTISLEVGTDSIDPATGRVKHTSLVAVAADRDTFMGFDLSNVVPQATLEHMGALISKNPFGRVGIDASKGVRSK